MVHCITMAGLPRLGIGGGGATAELSTFGTSVKSTVRRHLDPGWDGGLQLLLSAMATQFPLGTEVYSQICITGSTVPLGDLTQQTNLQQPGGHVTSGAWQDNQILGIDKEPCSTGNNSQSFLC